MADPIIPIARIARAAQAAAEKDAAACPPEFAPFECQWIFEYRSAMQQKNSVITSIVDEIGQ